MRKNIASETLEAIGMNAKQLEKQGSIPYSIAAKAIQESYERGVMDGTEGVFSAIREMFKGRNIK